MTWTNYKEALDIYQGSLDFKESYTKAFRKTSPEAIASGAYDSSKLRVVLGTLFIQCSEMASQMHRLTQE